MQGRVFYIVRPGQHNDFGHPNAVVVQLDADLFVCIAGFTPGKQKYEQTKDGEFKQGIWGPAFAVEIDHAKHLTPRNPQLKLQLCGYICQTAELMTSAQFRAGTDWGVLDDVAVIAIAEGLLAREAVRSFLPKKAVIALKKLMEH